jgi:hypothetical protein
MKTGKSMMGMKAKPAMPKGKKPTVKVKTPTKRG